MDQSMTLTPDVFEYFKLYESGEIKYLPKLYAQIVLRIVEFSGHHGADPVLMYYKQELKKEHFEMCFVINKAAHLYDFEYNKKMSFAISQINTMDFSSDDDPAYNYAVKIAKNQIETEINNYMRLYHEQI